MKKLRTGLISTLLRKILYAKRYSADVRISRITLGERAIPPPNQLPSHQDRSLLNRAQIESLSTQMGLALETLAPADVEL